MRRKSPFLSAMSIWRDQKIHAEISSKKAEDKEGSSAPDLHGSLVGENVRNGRNYQRRTNTFLH